MLTGRFRVAKGLRPAMPSAFRVLWWGTLANRAGAFVGPFLTLYLVDGRGFAIGVAGGALLCFGLGSLIGQWVGGWSADVHGRRATIVVSMFAAAGSYGLLGAAPSPPWVWAAGALAGACTDAYRPAVGRLQRARHAALLRRRADPDLRPRGQRRGRRPHPQPWSRPPLPRRLRGHRLRIRQILGLLDTEENPVRRLVAVGGGTQGGLWTQIVSDVTGREQEIPEHTIGASYGDALLSAIGASLVPPDTNWGRTAKVVRPDPAQHAAYQELAAIYDGLYPATRDLVHRLARLQH